MFVLTTLVYPVVLALLCVGAGLLVDWASGGVLAAMLIAAIGGAALIVVSQLTTYVAPIAPATPYLLAAVAATGFALGRRRVQALAGAWRASLWQLLVAPLAYVLALAPVLLAGRPTFSSYMVLADSAVHMLGADFLIRHGQDYSHLDLRNSYGATIEAYYNTSYPSGADTLLGGSAFLLRLPLIWTFQPFTALMIATATGPAWVLARRIGLVSGWAVLAALTVTLPALVYAYELIGSVKEIVALPLILSMGALVVTHRRWMWRGARGVIPFALVVAAGVGALGVAFGAWALAATIVLAALAVAELVGERGKRVPARREGAQAPPAREGLEMRGVLSARRLGGLFAAGALMLLVGAWPTWVDLSGSLHVAQAIASTSNPGNLHTPLHPTQLLGMWLGGSYKLLPTGVALTLTSVLVALMFILAVVGVGNVVRSGWYALAGWFALMVVLWLALRTYATTWADAKTLMLTSPVVVMMAWAGIAALRASRALAMRIAALMVAFVLVGGVLASDALQYHSSNLAPTARYEELASVNTRFAGRGPALFTDFDEYALYELRDMDMGGPDFASPPPALAAAANGYGRPVMLDRIAPGALAAYPLVVTRRDPTSTRPPAVYRLLWQGSYYQVWGRRPGAKPALAHVVVWAAAAPSAAPASPASPASPPPAAPASPVLPASPVSLRSQCAQVARLATVARSRTTPRAAGSIGSGARRAIAAGLHEERLVGAFAPELVTVALVRTHRPPGWGLARPGIVMGRPGTLHATFRLPHGGIWELWLKGEVMRAVRVSVDGRPLGSLGAQLDGNSLVPNTLTPLRARLSAGAHILTITRPGASLAPGDGGAAVLAAIFLTPAAPAGQPTLTIVPVDRWRSLCGRLLQWIELVPTP